MSFVFRIKSGKFGEDDFDAGGGVVSTDDLAGAENTSDFGRR